MKQFTSKQINEETNTFCIVVIILQSFTYASSDLKTALTLNRYSWYDIFQAKIEKRISESQPLNKANLQSV